MQVWLNLEYVRAHCEALREEAARMRLARNADRAKGGTRLYVARALLAVGTLFVAAGNRVHGDARLAN
jgi:hypothetical protein